MAVHSSIAGAVRSLDDGELAELVRSLGDRDLCALLVRALNGVPMSWAVGVGAGEDVRPAQLAERVIEAVGAGPATARSAAVDEPGESCPEETEEAALLQLLSEAAPEGLDAAEIREGLGIGAGRQRSLVQKLRREGLIVCEGQTRWAIWRLA